MFDVIAARIAIINYVLQPFEISIGESSFDIGNLLDHLPQGDATDGQLKRILTTLNGSTGLRQVLQPLDQLQEFLIGEKSDARSVVQMVLHAVKEPSLQNLADRRVFDRWMAVFRRAISGYPSQRGEGSVSLYHEVKVLSALVHASHGDPDSPMMLIEGDFPGIQSMIYAIDVKGAAKNVRGRSFFLQLMTESVVHRILYDLDLPMTNALYVAGGKFLLLVPASSQDIIDRVCAEINHGLLARFNGTMRFVLVAEQIHGRDLHTADDFQTARKRLKVKLGHAKTQPFQTLIGRDPASMFSPMYDDEIHRLEAKEESEFNQAVFGQLATDLANRKQEVVRLVFSHSLLSGKEEHYSRFLRDICGIGCQIQSIDQQVDDGDVYIQRLNSMDFDLSTEHGFRMLAVHTPTIGQEDIGYWYRQPHWEGDIFEGAIRTFDLLATQAREANNFKRYGVLRMDVDNLGKIFSSSIGVDGKPTVTETIATSEAMSLFFEAYLPQLCRKMENDHNRPNSLYLIYGGGDDLFVVGEWDLLPELAVLIHERFSIYTNGEASISAGIVLLQAHFPFYQAAELARVALDDRAKAHPDKNAIDFFDHVFSWDEWHEVVQQQRRLRNLAKKLDSNTVTRKVMAIYNQWIEKDKYAGHKPGAVRFGRYKWMAAYQIARLKKQYKGVDVVQDIDDVQNMLLKPETIQYAGIAALWAELVRRTHGA